MIKALSEDLRNKISAGEVVERPASVVKELIENSLDANSSSILIVIENGGRETIQVRDDGEGMSKDDIASSILRFHTSKIRTFEDISLINTLGFRGEALSSISSVSDISIISDNGQDVGNELKTLNGKLDKIRPAASIEGTEITISNLFYNTPARKKFLKTPRTELRKIVDVVRRFGLAYPEVEFKLISDNRKIFHVQPEKLEERIDNLLDPTYSRNLIKFNFTKGDYAFSGVVGNLNLVRSRPGEQYLFLNRRFIKDRLINRSIYNAYDALIKRGEFPFFIVNLVIPGNQIDVNVHPMKTEVRFKDEWRVFNIIKSELSILLKNNFEAIPDFDNSYEQSLFFKNLPNDINGTFPNSHSETIQTNSNQNLFDFDSPKSKETKGINVGRARDYVSKLAEKSFKTNESISTENIWQIHKKYIVSEVNSGLVIIDQHVAHERILYEEALKAFESTSMSSQTLLFPETLDFSPDDFDVLLDVLPYLEKIGFKIKKYNESSIKIEAIPSEMAIGNERDVIRQIIDNFLNQRKKYSSFQEGLAAMFACKAAIKAGDVLVKEEMRELVNRLFSTSHPYYCPHGRPIIVQLSLEELDSRFERI